MTSRPVVASMCVRVRLSESCNLLSLCFLSIIQSARFVNCFSSRNDHSICFAPSASLEYHRAPKSNSKSSRKSSELKPAVIKRTLLEKATTLEKEKAKIPDAERCKIQHDVKKSVGKAICDIFRSLGNNQIYIELRDGITLVDRLTRDKDQAEQNGLATGNLLW